MNWHYRHTVLALCTVAFFATMVARLAISPVVPAITAEFEITNTTIGFALTGMWMAYAVTQYPSGVLGDRVGERLVILVAVAGTAFMCLLLAVSPAFSIFFGCALVLGAVAGLHYSVATTLLTRTFDNIGTAIGIHTIGGSVAGLLAPIAAAWVGVRYGWRPAVAIGAVVAAPVFVLFAWRVRPTVPRYPETPMVDRIRVRPAATLLSRPDVAFTLVLASAGGLAWQGLASFLPTFLIEFRGQSPTLASVVFSSYFVVQIVVKPGIGAFSDRYGRDLAIGGCMVAAASGLATFLVVPGILSVVVAVVLTGVGLSWAAAVEPRFMDVLSESERGTGFGLVRTVYLVVGSLGSVGIGFLSDSFGWTTAIGALVGLELVIVGLLAVNWALELGY